MTCTFCDGEDFVPTEKMKDGAVQRVIHAGLFPRVSWGEWLTLGKPYRLCAQHYLSLRLSFKVRELRQGAPPLALFNRWLSRQVRRVARKLPCAHGDEYRFGRDRKGNQRYACRTCGRTWLDSPMQGSNQLAPAKEREVLDLLERCVPIREIHRRTGVSKAAIAWRAHAMGERVCPCGNSASHRGFCSWRMQFYPRRRAWLRKKGWGYTG